MQPPRPPSPLDYARLAGATDPAATTTDADAARPNRDARVMILTIIYIIPALLAGLLAVVLLLTAR